MKISQKFIWRLPIRGTAFRLFFKLFFKIVPSEHQPHAQYMSFERKLSWLGRLIFDESK